MSLLKKILKPLEQTTELVALHEENDSPKEISPVRSNILRRAVNECLGIEENEANSLRDGMLTGNQIPDKYLYGSSRVRYSILSISEKKPLHLVFGIVGWMYALVYIILKLTVLV